MQTVVFETEKKFRPIETESKDLSLAAQHAIGIDHSCPAR
jgi:hypothetical protein